MKHSRSRNYGSGLTPLVPPQGKTFIYADTTEELDGAVYIKWTYIGDDDDSVTGYRLWFAFADKPDVTIKEVLYPAYISDALVEGFANGTKYRVRVVAYNEAGNCMLAAATQFTPRLPDIPSPVLSTLIGGDGQAIASWVWGAVKNGYTYQYMSFKAANENKEIVELHVTGGDYPNLTGVLPLPNYHDWKCQLVAVATNDDTGRPYVSGLSNAITVNVSPPSPPAAPTITDCHFEGANIVMTWKAPYDTPVKWWNFKKKKRLKSDGVPTKPTRWDVDIDYPDGSEFTNVYVNSESVRTYKVLPVTRPDTYTVRVRGTNDLGFGSYSEPVYVTYAG